MENEKHDLKNFIITPCMPVGSATLSIAMQKFYTYFHYFYWIRILKLSKNARIPMHSEISFDINLYIIMKIKVTT